MCQCCIINIFCLWASAAFNSGYCVVIKHIYTLYFSFKFSVPYLGFRGPVPWAKIFASFLNLRLPHYVIRSTSILICAATKIHGKCSSEKCHCGRICEHCLLKWGRKLRHFLNYGYRYSFCVSHDLATFALILAKLELSECIKKQLVHITSVEEREKSLYGF